MASPHSLLFLVFALFQAESPLGQFGQFNAFFFIYQATLSYIYVYMSSNICYIFCLLSYCAGNVGWLVKDTIFGLMA